MPSSVIRAFRYHGPEKRLWIEFTSGRRYSYLDVPTALAAKMRSAFSKGEFFNENIRDRFRFVRET